MNRVTLLAVLSVTTLVLSIGFGWVSATGYGEVVVEELVVETPYVSGCCALIDDPLASVPFTLYRPADSSLTSVPVVITLQQLGEDPSSLTALNIELARRNMAAISINLPEGMDYSNMTWKGRQLSDIMAFLRDTIENIEYQYAVITVAKSASIAFSMNFLFKHPSAIVTVGYNSEWDQPARIYDGNLLLISSPAPLEVLSIVEERENLTSAYFGLDYGDLSFGNASGSKILDESQLNLNNQEVIESSIDWVLKTLHSDNYEEDGLDTIESITESITITRIMSDILLGGGFLLGVVAIVEFRRYQH